MPLSREVVGDFLRRKLDNHDWIKEIDERLLDLELSFLNPIPHFHTEPYKHQKAVFLLLLEYPGFLPFLNMGLGKSKIVLDVLAYRKLKSEGLPALILVPGRAHIGTWEREIERHQPSLSAEFLDGGTKKRKNILDSTNADIYVMNYQGMTAMCRAGASNGKSSFNPEEVGYFSKRFDSLIMDESQHVSNHSALITRICGRLSREISHRVAMTGTPHGRDPQLVWSQFFLCDHGETLGRTLGIFRAAFFHRNRNRFGGFEYEIKATRKDDLFRTMKHRSIFYSSEECIDLPDRVGQKIFCEMPKLTKKSYFNLIDEMNAGLAEEDAKARFSLVKNTFIRLRQLSGGFLTVKDEETGESSILDFPENPKLDALIEKIQEMPSDCKAVVFHEFIHSGRKIEKALKTSGIGHVGLRGETKDPSKVLKRFFEDPKVCVLVANHKSGGSGLNLQNANYVFFYESPVSSIARSQAEKRCWRMGQDKRVYFYDLLMKDSVDERILHYIGEGENLLTALMQGSERLRNEG